VSKISLLRRQAPVMPRACAQGVVISMYSTSPQLILCPVVVGHRQPKPMLTPVCTTLHPSRTFARASSALPSSTKASSMTGSSRKEASKPRPSWGSKADVAPTCRKGEVRCICMYVCGPSPTRPTHLLPLTSPFPEPCGVRLALFCIFWKRKPLYVGCDAQTDAWHPPCVCVVPLPTHAPGRMLCSRLPPGCSCWVLQLTRTASPPQSACRRSRYTQAVAVVSAQGY
jgi:hypothetical protein